MKGWKFALLPVLLLGGSFLSGCSNQNPPLTKEEVQALIDPLLRSNLQALQYTSPSYTTQENRPFVEAQNSGVKTDVNCSHGGYITYQFTLSRTTTGATYSGSADLNRCVVLVLVGKYAETAKYERGTFRISGSFTQVSDNTNNTFTADFDTENKGEGTIVFRDQSYSIRIDLESKARIVVSTSRSSFTSSTVGMVRINGYLYQVNLRQEFTTP